MEIDLQDYRVEYKEHQDEQEEKGNVSHSTVRQRKYAADELVEYFNYHGKVLDTDDFYDSTDELKAFFDQTTLHQSKVACIRDFLKYIKKQLPTKEADRLHDIRERIKHSRLTDTSGKGQSKRKRLEEKILDEDELQAVYDAAPFKEELIIRAMLDMGTRLGELAALTPNDINWDFQKGEIAATVKIDKTYSQGVGVKDTPKTEDSIRTVNLRERTVDMLEQYIDENGIDNNELLFEDYRSVYNLIKDVFTYACVKRSCDYMTRFSPHSLRHNTATRLIREGYPKEKVQQYLGHSSVKITEIYEHLDEDRVVDIYA